MALYYFGHLYIAHFLMHSINFMHARVLKFHIWIPYEKVANTYFFSLSGLCPFPELWPLEKTWMKYCQQNLSITIDARALKFEE